MPKYLECTKLDCTTCLQRLAAEQATVATKFHVVVVCSSPFVFRFWYHRLNNATERGHFFAMIALSFFALGHCFCRSLSQVYLASWRWRNRVQRANWTRSQLTRKAQFSREQVNEHGRLWDLCISNLLRQFLRENKIIKLQKALRRLQEAS